MGTRCLLLAAIASVAALTLLRGAAPAVARGLRPTAAIPEESPTAPEPLSERLRVLDDATGEPVAGAEVTFFETGAKVRTDDAGRFDPFAVEFYAFVVRADGYPPMVFAREATVLRLRRGTWKTLTIVDEDGRPGAGATVEVYCDGILLSTAEADENGLALLHLVGTEWMRVRLAGHAYADVDRAGRVELGPSYTIGGTVVDTAGRPVAGARVHLWQGGG